MSDIAPNTAERLKTVSQSFTFLKSNPESAKKNKAFQTLSNFPVFINVHLLMNRDAACNETPMGSENMSVPLVHMSLSMGVMMAARHVKVDMTPEKSESARNSYNKFLSLIRMQELARHHSSAEITSVQADTDEGYYSFITQRHAGVLRDLECLTGALVMQACRETLTVQCSVDQHEDQTSAVMLTEVDTSPGKGDRHVLVKIKMVVNLR